MHKIWLQVRWIKYNYELTNKNESKSLPRLSQSRSLLKFTRSSSDDRASKQGARSRFALFERENHFYGMIEWYETDTVGKSFAIDLYLGNFLCVTYALRGTIKPPEGKGPLR